MELDLAAFAPRKGSDDNGKDAPQFREGLQFGGLPILKQNWDKFTETFQRKILEGQPVPKPEKQKATPTKRGPRQLRSTQAGIKWGQRQKKVDGTGRPWVLIDQENYNYKTRRHHDLQLGLDALFDDGGQGMVGIQSAGRYERKEHYQRFLDRGGPEKAKRRGIRVIYLEFVAGNPEPVVQEVWA